MQSKKYQLLIIEDDRTLAEGLQRALTMDDRQVHLCENLRKAKEYLQKETVDLILLDVNLPDGNGVDFLENVRKTSDVPVILEPGLSILSTSPAVTGSLTAENTTGI